ncbi:MAG TPA: NUDIX domain-containing protein [Smithellaceae bacterium]|jgi:8-oxo-dGTP diphosphatase|nr:NUDIX domain-containing protein [Smithellaceae bacterium]
MKKKRKFCIYCGGQITKSKEDDVFRDCCSSCHCFFYDNPLPVVSAIVDESRKILLVKRDRAPFKGHWCLPTGFAEAGESIEDAALRELMEETGVKGRISRLLDVDSYKSRFYGDLLFLTFVVDKTGGKVMAGDDSAQAKFFPIKEIPPLAFRSNRRALEAYVKSKKDYWAILDAIEHRDDGRHLPRHRDSNALTRRLLNVILKNKEKMINQWIEEMTTSPSTSEYHGYEIHVLYNICDKIISQITLWLGNAYDIERIKNFYIKLGVERKKAGAKISGVLSALSLIRKHIWDVALAQGALQKNLDLYMTFELQRRMTIFFDLATFYITRGYEEHEAARTRNTLPAGKRLHRSSSRD